MDDAKYNRQMRAAEKDKLRNYLLDGGLGAYIHYNRANYIKYGIAFDEIDAASRNTINFEEAHTAAKNRLHEFQEKSRMTADIAVAKIYNQFYNTLDTKTEIQKPDYNLSKETEQKFYDTISKIVQKAVNTEIDANGNLKHKKVTANDVKNVLHYRDLTVKMPPELKKFFEKHSYLFEKDKAGRNKRISEKNLLKFKSEIQLLVDFIKKIEKNGKINAQNAKKMQEYLYSGEAKNYRKAINFLMDVYTEDIDIPWETVIAIDEKASAALAMCVGKGVGELTNPKFIKNAAKNVNQAASFANGLLKVQINDYSSMVNRKHMLSGITTEERKMNNTHHMIGFNTKHINKETIIRRDYNLWKIAGNNSVEFDKGSKGTTDAYIEYELLPDKIKRIYNDFNMAIKGIGISEKKYDGLVTLVDGTNFDTALNSAPVAFLNHYYNLVASRRDNTGYKKDPSISPNSGTLDTNLALANQTIKCYMALRSLAGVRTRGDSTNQQTDFLMVTNPATGKKTIYSVRRILSIIETNIAALETTLKITGLPKTSVRNVWMDNAPSLAGARKRITRLMAALHTRKVTVKVNINNNIFNSAKGLNLTN